MSATFIVNDSPELHSVWMPTAATFDEILDLIIEKLALHDAALAKYVCDLIVPSFYGSLKELNTDQFNTLLAVADQVFESVITENTEISQRASSQLHALLKIDSRNSQINQANRGTTIHFSADLFWTAPQWVVDLVAEMTLQELRRANPSTSVSKLLLEWRSPSASHNLFDVLEDDYCKLLTVFKWLTVYFDHPQRGRMTVSNEFSPIVYSKTRELLEIACRDNRSLACVSK